MSQTVWPALVHHLLCFSHLFFCFVLFFWNSCPPWWPPWIKGLMFASGIAAKQLIPTNCSLQLSYFDLWLFCNFPVQRSLSASFYTIGKKKTKRSMILSGFQTVSMVIKYFSQHHFFCFCLCVQLKKSRTRRFGWSTESQRRCASPGPSTPATSWPCCRGSSSRHSTWPCRSEPSWRHSWASRRHRSGSRRKSKWDLPLRYHSHCLSSCTRSNLNLNIA